MGTLIINPYLSKLWTPSLIATDMWFDATNTSSVVITDGKVSAWNDLSGNNLHALQSDSFRRPSYNLDAIVFSGSQFLNLPPNFFSAMQGGDFTVAYCTENHTSGAVMAHAYNWGSYYHNIFQGNFRFDIGRSGVDESSLLPIPANTNRNVFIHSFSDSLNIHKATINGVDYTTTYNNSILHSSGDRPTIGAALTTNGSLAGLLNGSIKEIVAINGYDYFDLLTGYLAHKHNTVGSLPNDHPYKNNPPYV